MIRFFNSSVILIVAVGLSIASFFQQVFNMPEGVPYLLLFVFIPALSVFAVSSRHQADPAFRQYRVRTRVIGFVLLVFGYLMMLGAYALISVPFGGLLVLIGVPGYVLGAFGALVLIVRGIAYERQSARHNLPA